MLKRGSVSKGGKGSYKVFPMYEVGPDNVEQFIGYVVVGPGSDSTRLVTTIEEAIAIAEKLSDDYDSDYQP
ncbi:hypothetical protein NYP20_16345 [Pseudomonas sp. N3-W]|uniref:hypothetical protein n=1 Tax=Pseudomonas sp. N3-W TaxID=2975049 RepID=UPI00217E677C|nr:hypothetical protein [Pseudomonas sp. N3-W]UWF46920.1 hypothetical protein NYP20_16345 [Pseudomonas sp. N3-W]